MAFGHLGPAIADTTTTPIGVLGGWTALEIGALGVGVLVGGILVAKGIQKFRQEFSKALSF